jgi:4-hydroxybutyrate CoA-transferase
MMLQKQGIVTNLKKRQHMGYSTTALIVGSKALYEFVHLRAGIQMRPCAVTNATDVIRKNSPFISINTAMEVDLFGNVWADYVDVRHYYSGVGGQPDFVRALNDPAYGVPIITIKSITGKGESKIAKVHPPGVSLTASAYDGVVIVDEYGIADLRGLTAGEKALAVASIAHPRFRDEYLKSFYDDPLFTKAKGCCPGKPPRGVTMYQGSIRLDEE